MNFSLPNDKPRLVVILQSQFALLATAVRDPVALIRELNKNGPAQVGDLNSLSVPQLQALVWENAEKILELLLTRSLT